MPLLYLLPSFGYALYLATSSGNYTLLLLVAASGLAMQLSRSLMTLRPDGALEFIAGRVRIGGRLLPRAPWLWPTAVRNRVWQALCEPPQLDREKLYRDLLANPRGMLLGVSEGGHPLYLNFRDHNAHLMIIGPTGAGKTQLIRSIIAGWWGEVWAVDFKGGMGFRDIPGLAKLHTNLSADGDDFWVALNLELDRRETETQPKPLLVVVDELGAVLNLRDAAVGLERIVTKGRSLGVHLIAANQTLSAIGRNLLANCQLRVAVGNTDSVDRAQLGIRGAVTGEMRAILLQDACETQFWFDFAPANYSAETAASNPFLKT